MSGTEWGGEITGHSRGRLGFEVGAFADSGSFDARFTGIGNLSLPDFTTLGSQPVRSTFGYDSRSTGIMPSTGFSTQSPQVGAYADLVFDLDAIFGATGCLGGCTGFKLPLDLEFKQELVAVNREKAGADDKPPGGQFDGEIRTVVTKLADYKEAVDFVLGKNDKNIPAPTPEKKSGGGATEKTGKKGLKAGIFFNLEDTDASLLGQKISRQYGVQVPGDLVRSGNASLGVELGSAEITLPNVQLTSKAPPAANGVLTASSSDIDESLTQVAKVDVDFAAIAGTLLGVPGAGGTIKAGIEGVVDLEVTTVSYKLGPTLRVEQEAQVVPNGTILLEFDQSTGVKVGDAAAFRFARQARFVPGTDVQVLFQGKPIDVTPSFEFGARFDNRIDLVADLDGKLEALALELEVFGEKLIDAGPLITNDHSLLTGKPVAQLFGDSVKVKVDPGKGDKNTLSRVCDTQALGAGFDGTGALIRARAHGRRPTPVARAGEAHRASAAQAACRDHCSRA